MVKLAIIILNYNTAKLTIDCIDSIYKFPPREGFQVLVVDNASTDNSVAEIKSKFRDVTIITSQENIGFSRGNNLGIKSVKAEYYLVLNSDTTVLARSLNNLLDFACSSNFQVLSCRLVNPDGSFQPNGGDLPTPLPILWWLLGIDDFLLTRTFHLNKEEFYHHNQTIGWVSGAAMLISKKVIDKIEGFDPAIFMYGEDVDLCWRAKEAGFSVGWTNKAEIVHLGGASLDNPRYQQWLGEFRGLIYLYQKHFGLSASLALRIFIYFAVILRVIAFCLIGRFNFAQTYVQLIFKI